MVGKIASLIIFVLFAKISFSQKYQPIDSTIVWSTEEFGKLMTGCYQQSYCKYYQKGYELNNSRVWTKVYISHYEQAMGPWNYCMTYVAPGTVYNAFFGYMYNDTVTKKVYYKGYLPTNYTPTNTDVVYDFNKTVGDTMYLQSGMNYPFKFPIASIDSILFSGKYHKRFFTTCSPNYPIMLSNKWVTFTEGIGSSLGALTQTVNGMGEFGSSLVCFASPTQTMSITTHSIYANSTNCYNLALGINHIKEEEIFSVYPNPANDQITISKIPSGEQELNYSIINLLGSIQQSGLIENKENKIQLKGIPTGVYFLKIVSKENIILTKKITILRE